MAPDIGLPVLESADLTNKDDLQKLKKMFDDEKARLMAEEGKGMRRMSILVGKSNMFDEVVICTTTKKYVEKLLNLAGPEQISQKAKINGLSCLKMSV